LQELTRQNGEGIARSILDMSEMHTCPNPDHFVASLRDMFNALDPEVIRTRTSEVLQDMIEELRQHQVGARFGGGGAGSLGTATGSIAGGCAALFLPACLLLFWFAYPECPCLQLVLPVLCYHNMPRPCTAPDNLSAALACTCSAAAQVTLKATVSTVVVTTLVLEGWSRELNPDLHIMDALRDMLAVDWKERLSRAVDKVRRGEAEGA
jgi:hypothetical protein